MARIDLVAIDWDLPIRVACRSLGQHRGRLA
jgi:hypothetical protein